MTKETKLNWTKITLNNPVVFRTEISSYIIRNLRNIKGNIMCELEMDDDKMMRNMNDLPDVVQDSIKHRLTLQHV